MLGEPRLDILKQIAIPFLLTLHRSIIMATSIMLGGSPSIHQRTKRELSTSTASPRRRQGNQKTFRGHLGRHDGDHLHMKILCLQPLMQRPGPSRYHHGCLTTLVQPLYVLGASRKAIANSASSILT